jgi:class 3 adenylate cyclase
MDRSWVQWRRSLFQKYLVVLFIVVIVPLLANGISDAWFGYRDQRTMLNALLRTEAASAAGRIESFLDGITDQLSWTVRQAWSAGAQEQHRFDALGVLRQVPAVVSITLVDGDGIEQLYVSRIDMNRIASGVDRSRDPAVSGVRSARTWYGPVTYYHDSEPFMTVAVAGNRKAAGVAVAEINLKFIWNVISAIRVGHTGHAFVLDQSSKLIAHPDISLVLRGTNDEALMAMRRLRHEIDAASGEAITIKNTAGETVVTAMAAIPGADWMVFVEQPLSEAFGPIRSALWRTGGMLLAGIAFAGALAYWLARRMTGPIRQLEEGTERIGAGQFDHRINIATGDEFERLATRFNRMAGELAVSQERSERIARLKRFLAPQVAELVEKEGDENILAGQRAEVVVVFCDLRDFTAFSARSEPEEIMQVLGDYYEALGSVITRYEATLTSFSGDGLMVLINAPVPCADPALRAVEMAIDMQKVVQSLIAGWRSRGYAIGFGVGLAMGPATVGRIGYESRAEYTAIGNVVNLASRLCSSAEDEQILIDPVLAEAVRDKLPLVALGTRRFKGFDKELAVYNVGSRDGQGNETSSDTSRGPNQVSAEK